MDLIFYCIFPFQKLIFVCCVEYFEGNKVWLYTVVLYVVHFFQFLCTNLIRVCSFLSRLNGSKHMDQVFQCVLHHAEDLSSFNDPEYVGLEEILDCDPDFFSYFALLTTLKRLGYISLKSLWYFDPTMEDGMIPLNSNIGCRRMQNIAYQFDKVHLYVVHPMSQPEIGELNSLIEYPIMAPPVAPPVRNETNEGPTSVGPTAEGEGSNVDGGVSGVGPTTENELFGEYDNGPGLGDDETQTEVGQNSHGPELEKETVNVSEPTVEEIVNVGELVLGNENDFDFDFGLGNENEDMAGEKEDSALDVHFGESEDEVGITGDLDNEVGGNGVNVDLNAETDTVRVEGEVNNVENQTEVGEGSVRVEGEDNTANKGKKKKG